MFIRFLIIFALLLSSHFLNADRANHNDKIISLDPSLNSFSRDEALLASWQEMRDVSVTRPEKIGSEEIHLLRYAIKIGKHKNTHLPLYFWKESSKTFENGKESSKADFEQTLSLEQSLSQIPPQAIIYTIYDGEEEHKVVFLIQPTKGLNTVVYGDNEEPSKNTFEFKTSLDAPKIFYQEKVVQHILQAILKMKPPKEDIHFSDLKNVQTAEIVSTFEVKLGNKHNVTPKAHYGFNTYQRESLSIQGNPAIPTFLTHLRLEDKKVELDRIVVGDMEALKSYLKENMKKDKAIVRNEKDLLETIKEDLSAKKINKKHQFLKEDIDRAIIEASPEAISQAVDSIINYFDGNMAWDFMPENVRSKEDLYENLKDVITTAKKLHIPDIVLLNAAERMIDTVFNPHNYQSVKTPDHYLLMKKDISLGKYIEGLPSDLMYVLRPLIFYHILSH